MSNKTSASFTPEEASDDRGPGLRAFTIVIMTISILSVILRFWSRSLAIGGNQRISRFWWDDWLALSSLPPLLAAGALLLELINLGLGRHIWTLPPANLVPQLTRLWAIYYLYNTSLVLAKTSCLFFYTRIFSAPQVSKRFSFAIWVGHTLNIGIYIGNIFTVTFNLSPEAQTNPGYSPNVAKVWLGSAVPSVFIDLVLLIMPLPMVWKLRVGQRKKFAIFCVFVCGYSVVMVSLGRLITVAKGIEHKDIVQDLTYAGVPSIYWQAAEGPMTLVCVCIPSLLTLFRRVNCFMPGSRSNNNSANSGQFQQKPRHQSHATFSTKELSSLSFKRGTARSQDDEGSISQSSDRVMLQPLESFITNTIEVQRPKTALKLRDEGNVSSIRVQHDIDVSSYSPSDRG